jgi:uncharacterized protein (DUF302 family)
MVTRIEVERFSVTSAKPFEDVVQAVKAAIGRPGVGAFATATKNARTFAEPESSIQRALGTSGFMLFMELDHGAFLQKESGKNTPRIVRLIVGNPLIMKEMAKRVPDAGSYAPVTVLIDERSDGVHLSYDRMAGFLAPYRNSDALAVARDLDAKVEALLSEAAG